MVKTDSRLDEYLTFMYVPVGTPDLRLQERSLNSNHCILVPLCLPVETDSPKSRQHFVEPKLSFRLKQL